jgi:hypothetical protein
MGSWGQNSSFRNCLTVFLPLLRQGLILVGRRSGQGWPKATAKRHGLDGEKHGVSFPQAKDGTALMRGSSGAESGRLQPACRCGGAPLEPVTKSHAAVCFTSALIRRAGSVAGEHFSASPTGKAHQILFLSAVGQPPMRERVTEHVRVEVIQTSLLGAASKHLANAVVRHATSAANPELGTPGEAMLGSLPQVTLDGLASLVAERTGTRSAALSQHEGNISIKINVCDRQARHLGQAHAGIEEQPNDGRVTSVVKNSAAHATKQASELGLSQDGHRLLRGCSVR